MLFSVTIILLQSQRKNVGLKSSHSKTIWQSKPLLGKKRVPTALTYLSCSLTPSVAIWSHWSLTDEIKDNSGWLLVFSEDQITSPRRNVRVQNSSVKSFWLICKTGIFLIVISPANRMTLTMAVSISTSQTIELPVILASISVLPGGSKQTTSVTTWPFSTTIKSKLCHLYLYVCLFKLLRST